MRKSPRTFFVRAVGTRQEEQARPTITQGRLQRCRARSTSVLGPEEQKVVNLGETPQVILTTRCKLFDMGSPSQTGLGRPLLTTSGNIAFFGLPPGRYYLSANYRPSAAFETAAMTSGNQTAEEDYLPVYYPRGTDPAFATTIEARPGAQLTGIDFMLTKSSAVHIRGRVNNSMGKGIVSVTLAPADQTRPLGMNRTYVTDSQGRFDIRGI